LIVGGVLDNVCNSACQTCNAGLSTKIGSLEKNYIKTNNLQKFFRLPQHRILEVDVNGGEPTASKNYKVLLKNLPSNTKIVRMNTNGSKMINELIDLLENKIMVIVTISFDGTNDVHDYVRWPIKWEKFTKTVAKYKKLQEQHKLLKLNFWTTVSCLNIKDFPNIIKYASDNNIDHNWAFLNTPEVLNIKYKNSFTTETKIEFLSSNNKTLQNMATHIAIEPDNSKQLSLFIKRQDYLRKLNINNYLSF
jgi:sulfatase maturation enzyme AslB (radical SAM superfamily)